MPFFPDKEMRDLIYSYTYKKGQRIAGPKKGVSEKDIVKLQKRFQKRRDIYSRMKNPSKAMKDYDTAFPTPEVDKMLKRPNKFGKLFKGFSQIVGTLPLTRKSLVKKGVKKLVNPATKNLGRIKPSKTKVIKDVRGLKKK
tara:strand:- start:76 stop:495 length:420 start_codon:yes stop_codon:yes gene_type:complete